MLLNCSTGLRFIVNVDSHPGFFSRKIFMPLTPTRFSTLAGTARAGTPLNNLSKQTPKSHFSPYEPEHLEPDHK